jgi:hypothetical protein
MAIRGVSQDALMAHLGLTPQSWHTNIKAGGWFVSDVPHIAALLQVDPALLQARGVVAPDAGPAAGALLRQPSIAALTDAALADIRQRVQDLVVALTTESVGLIVAGAVPVPGATLAANPTPAEVARYRRALDAGEPGAGAGARPRRAGTRK